MTSHRLLGAIYLALSVAMIAWDILMAGRIAQLRKIPRGFQAITGIAGLLLVPALVVAYEVLRYREHFLPFVKALTAAVT